MGIGISIGMALGRGGGLPYMAYTNKLKALAPIAHWSLAEPSGSVATDESGNGRNGAYTAVTLGAAGIGDGRTSAGFNGTSGTCSIYSASLAGAFNKDEGTAAVWMLISAGVWADATDRRAFYLGTDGSNRVFIQKNATSNQLSAQYQAGGTTKTVTVSSFSPTAWFHVAASWSKAADQFKLYLNGVQSGATQTGLGTWAGVLTSSNVRIGSGAGPGNFTSGNLAHAAVWATPLTAAQIAALATL